LFWRCLFHRDCGHGGVHNSEEILPVTIALHTIASVQAYAIPPTVVRVMASIAAASASRTDAVVGADGVGCGASGLGSGRGAHCQSY
jgi:hypothetical protein